MPRPIPHPRAVRVLVVPDKFKGTLSADRVARAIRRGWLQRRPDDHVEILPMSDGGDGFGPIVGRLLGATTRVVTTLDAAGRPRRARWWWAARQRTAILETAQSNGLALLPPGQFHPFDLDTRGVAALVRAAAHAGARRCLLGVGGSATNDAGFGLAAALGWQFLDRAGTPIDRWTALTRLHRLVPPASPEFAHLAFTVATDVGNPLLGRQGATRVYGPQKGLAPRDLPSAERALRRLAEVVESTLGFASTSPGSGAAGGLGFGLQAFLGADRRLGFDLFADLADLDRRIARADLVLTGEGAFDTSSLMGKGVGQLIQRCAQHDKPVMVVAGRIQLGRRPPRSLLHCRALIDLVDEATAKREPARLLRRAAKDLAALAA